jgi:hypothetical protein
MSIKDDVVKLRAIPAEWKNHQDPLRELRIIRHGFDPQLTPPRYDDVFKEAMDKLDKLEQVKSPESNNWKTEAFP